MFTSNIPDGTRISAPASGDGAALGLGGETPSDRKQWSSDRRPCQTERSTDNVDDGSISECLTREVIAHSDYLLRRAWGLTNQRADAEDLVQETLLKAYLSCGNFRRGSNLRSWLNRIMLNTWVDGYRSAQRRPAEQLSAEIPEAQTVAHAARLPNGPKSAEAEALQSLPTDAVLALRSLPQDLRETIYYADVEGYRNTEIAEFLDIPVGTVGSRLHRGRTRLRELLAESGDRRELA